MKTKFHRSKLRCSGKFANILKFHLTRETLNLLSSEIFGNGSRLLLYERVRLVASKHILRPPGKIANLYFGRLFFSMH